MTIRVSVSKAWDGSHTDCLHCSLRSSALFSGLTKEDFESIHEPVEQITLQPGDVIYQMGEAGHHLFTLRNGLIKLVQYLPDGSQRIVRLAKRSDVLGLEMMVGKKYGHEAIVLQTTELCRYPMEAVTRISRQNPILHKDLMARWQKALSDADDWITKFSTGSAKKRMANLLLRLIDKEGDNRCHIFGREDIGSILSITIETASRTISEFKRSGLIKELGHNHFELDIDALNAIIIS